MRSILGRALALAALVALLPAAAQAQSFEKNTRLGVFAGATVPTGDLGDFYNTGFNIGGMLEMKPALSPVGIRFDAAYNRMAFDEQATGFAGNASLWSISANAVLSPMASPVYLIGGLGLYSLSDNYSDPLERDQTISNKLGFNVGAGFRIPLTGFDTFIEARYHSMDLGDQAASSRATFIPISFGVRF